MNVHIPTVLNQNITLVYDALDLQTVNSGKLKGLIADIKPMVMDMPEMIVAVYPPAPIIIQIGDKRIRITLQQQNENIGSIPLWDIALRCQELVPQSQQLVAYGLNYDVAVQVENGDVQEITTRLFIPDLQVIEDVLNGKLLSFTPRLQFKREQVHYDLILEPLEKQIIKAHLNAHFGDEALEISEAILKKAFYQEFKYLTSMLPKLLMGEV